jgi:hypothetical protein
MFGKLLTLGEAEQDRLQPVVAEQGAAQDALVGRLDFPRQIEKMRVGWGSSALLLSSATQRLFYSLAVVDPRRQPTTIEDRWRAGQRGQG